CPPSWRWVCLLKHMPWPFIPQWWQAVIDAHGLHKRQFNNVAESKPTAPFPVGTPYMVSAQLALGVFAKTHAMAVHSVMVASRY
ncbi:MAG: hypothetical protein RR975_15605, partial [Clostridia bacterium]